MTAAGLDADLNRIAEICERYGVARLEIFGSVARGEVHPGSDIDVLYELAPGARLGWEIENLADELAEVFGREVDLVSRRVLHERLRPTVLAEARLLYAA
jgi:predicted nucleotidyltransferase